MLSALIPSVHSYPALQLVPKPVDQRYVQPGPLVTYSHVTMCVDYIFTLVRKKRAVGCRRIMVAQRHTIRPDARSGTSRYGVKPKIANSSSRVFLRFVT